MRWRMRIGHYQPEREIVLLDGRIDPPTFVTEEFRERYAYPGMTDEDLFSLVFFDFSRSIKIALLDESPLTPQEVHARGAAVYKRATEERSRRSRLRGKRRESMNDYLNACEQLYKLWSEGALETSDWGETALKKALGPTISYSHAPEPYLAFDGATITDVDSKQLVFLTTNPGGGMAFQTRERAAGRASYNALQTELVKSHYRRDSEDVGESALRRIERMRKIADCLKPITNTTGFVQCEMVPFHSNALPGKRRLAKWLREAGAASALASYQTNLKAFLADKHVISLDASNLPASTEWEHWLRFKANLLDFDENTAKPTPLGHSSKKKVSTCVFTKSKNGLIRACYLTQGGNDFRNHTSELCAALRESLK